MITPVQYSSQVFLTTLSHFLLGIPDYPPPSFQEAMTTPPLSACSSTTTLVPASIPAVLIPEEIPEVPEVLVEPSNVESLNELVVSDHGSDSDESLQIIDKSSVVGSDDLPKGVELEERIRNDWKMRRGLDFPGSSSSDSSQNKMDTDRGRSTRRVPGRLTIDPDTSAVEDPPISPTKRRFLSLSPLKTILSPRLTDRPMSAHPSPGSSPYAASSRNVFFRSSMNLATSSMMKFPISPDKNDNPLSRKLFGKGKEKLDTWEVLDEDIYPDEFEAEGDYPSSLMSAVQSLKLSTSVIVGDSPTRSQSYTVGVRPSTRTNQFPNVSQNGTMHEESKARQIASLRAGVMLDRQIWGTPAASASIVSGVAVPLGTDSPPARSISPVIHPRVESSTPAPSILKNTAPPIRPSPLRPTITTENQASSSIIYQQALETPLPATPVYRDMATISARSVPDSNDSISAGEFASGLAQIKFTEEPMTPNRHHYTGRPLPRPPPSVTRSNIDSTFAPEVVYDADIESHSSTCPEGLLIDLNDTSRCQERLLIDLDDTSLDGSGASTPLSDGAHLRSQLHLTMTPSTSAAELTTEPGSERSALSDSIIHRRSSPITSDVIQPFEPTELDMLASRIAYGGDDGSDYEVSSGHPRWLPSFNNSPDSASGLRVNRTGKPDPCPQSVYPSSYLASSQRQHFPHWANRS